MSKATRYHYQERQFKNDPRSEIYALWALRTLIYLKGHRSFINQHGFHDDDILNIIGLNDLTDISDINRKHAKKILITRLKKLESKGICQPNDNLTNNIRWLRDRLSLTAAEELILMYTITVSLIRDLRDAINTISNTSTGDFIYSLSTVLGISEQDCRSSLSTHSTLINSGLVKVDHSSRDFGEKLTPISNLENTLISEHHDKQDILNSFFEKTPSAKLTHEDFQHITSDYHLLKNYLSSVKSKKTKGVNFLIHGQPGVGKTEFVRMLSETLNLNLYEIAMKNDEGDSIDGKDRFSVYQLSQKLLSHQENCVILFDEVEDVFPESSGITFFGVTPSKKTGKKAWINHLLENNPIPAFWLSNHVNQIDPAYLRRFDYVMELKQPSRSGRKRIINKYLNNHNVKEDWINDIAQNENIAPSVIEKAAKVINHLSGKHEKNIEHSLNKVIGNTLEVFGHQHVMHTSNHSNIRYDINYINADHNINEICQGLKQNNNGRLCLYGASGTGKTALGHHIAKYIDKPLIVKRGSDIISMWVGGTEKNIANMFRHATDENAVLLLDEADSFIQNRQSAQHSWEITQVNELLVQMESFEGIFIASTNLIDILDSASLRRFDFKVKFDYMRKSDAIDIFNRIVSQEKWGTTLSPSELTSKINAIQNIALGDFNVAVRKMSFSENKTSSTFLQHLEGESRLKPDSQCNEIGFSANIH